MKLKWTDIWKTICNTCSAVIKGELLLRLRFDKYLMNIVWLFFLMTVAVWTNYKIEKSLLTVQKNKVEIETLRIIESETTCELERLKRINTVEKMLEEKGSEIGIPVRPASILEK